MAGFGNVGNATDVSGLSLARSSDSTFKVLLDDKISEIKRFY